MTCPKKLRHAALSWELIEHKYRYYILIKPIIQDYHYDMLEKEYEALCEELGLPNTVSNMVEIDMSRPSCQLVASKLGVKPIIKNKKKK